MKILTVVGARPQFIKAAVVSRAIAQHNRQQPNQEIHEIIVHTGQHYDHKMSEVFFAEMHIPHPEYNLGIGSSSHGAMVGRMLEKIEEVLLAEKPDVVLVYGDTNSTLAGALAAVKLHIPIAHVEAGLRSFNMRMPEEVNRLLTDQVSHWLFCPTEAAVKNLRSEGILEREQVQMINTGDVMYDAALFYQQIAKPIEATASLIEKLADNFYLATIHRAENTDDIVCLNNIMDALETISKNIPVVLPLHPRTRKILASSNLSFQHIQFIDPVSYFDMILLLKSCQGVFTDSGGLQKEAYFFQKPCITLRNETEWVELVAGGFNTITGADKDKILNAEGSIHLNSPNYSTCLYGSGNAAKKIIEILASTCL